MTGVSLLPDNLADFTSRIRSNGLLVATAYSDLEKHPANHGFRVEAKRGALPVADGASPYILRKTPR